MKKKKAIIAVCVVLAIFVAATIFLITANRGNISDANRIVGYSALYGDELINEAFNVVEKKFAEEFKGCTLTELRYDSEVENKFGDEIARYAKENNNKELIILLSTFNTDEKGGDGSLNPNATYTNFQWHLVRTEDKKSWEVITWGYG